MTGEGGRGASRTDESVRLIFPLVAEPAPKPAWVGKAVAAGVVVAVLGAALTVAADQVRSTPEVAKWAVVAAGADEAAPRAEFGGSRGRASVFELRPGTCLRDMDVRTDVQDVPVVPCGAEHRAEVIAIVQLPGDSWPGPAAVDDLAVETCVPAIFDVGIEPRGDLKWSYFGPTESSWTALDDRAVSCVIVSDGEPLVGSLMPGSTGDR
jgi:hypothetical protein